MHAPSPAVTLRTTFSSVAPTVMRWIACVEMYELQKPHHRILAIVAIACKRSAPYVTSCTHPSAEQWSNPPAGADTPLIALATRCASRVECQDLTGRNDLPVLFWARDGRWNAHVRSRDFTIAVQAGHKPVQSTHNRPVHPSGIHTYDELELSKAADIHERRSFHRCWRCRPGSRASSEHAKRQRGLPATSSQASQDRKHVLRPPRQQGHATVPGLYDVAGETAGISPVHMAFMTDSRGFRRRNMQGTEEQRDLHRIVEKRRRDRINDCLANIRELLPEELVRQKSCGKAEILELTLMHMKHLQKQVQAYEQGKTPPAATPVIRQGDFLAGYRECLGEAIRYMSQSPVDGISCEKLESHLRRHCQRLSPYQGFPDTEEPPGGLARDSISPQPEQQMHQERPMPEEPQPPQHPPHMMDASQQTPSPQTAQSHHTAAEEARRSPVREPPRERSPSRDSQPPHPPLPYTAFPPAPFIPMLALHPSGTHYIPVNFTPPTAVTPQGGQPGQNMVCPFPMMFPAPMYRGCTRQPAWPAPAADASAGSPSCPRTNPSPPTLVRRIPHHHPPGGVLTPQPYRPHPNPFPSAIQRPPEPEHQKRGVSRGHVQISGPPALRVQTQPQLARHQSPTWPRHASLVLTHRSMLQQCVVQT
ncbi:hypothetical protein Bbelb_181960 [Branchiostoma belcheri]|nr:hypothetical protein Bbelb_181960 [Branchiostoma belcheri]